MTQDIQIPDFTELEASEALHQIIKLMLARMAHILGVEDAPEVTYSSHTNDSFVLNLAADEALCESFAYDKQFGNRDDWTKVANEFGYEHIQREGGGEGGTEYVEGVFIILGQMFIANWRYYSHHGYDYDDIASCVDYAKPVQVTETQYTRV